MPTLEEFAPRFVEGHLRANKLKPSAIVATESILKCHVVPVLGPSRLDTISSERVQHLKLKMAKRAPKTVNNTLVVLSSLLKTAVEWGVIDRMPCAMQWMRVPTTTAKFHDFADFERLLAAAQRRSPDAHLVVLLAGEAGLRRGEIAASRWSDIEFKRRQLCVQRSVWQGQVTAPKGRRVRYVPMTKRLTKALQAARHLKGPVVFCDSDGAPASGNIIANHVGHSARAAKLSARGVHALRQSFCSHLATRGAPSRAIQELPGHADVRTTQRYMYLSPAALSDAIRLLDGPVVPSSLGDILETDTERSVKSL